MIILKISYTGGIGVVNSQSFKYSKPEKLVMRDQ